MLTLVPTPIGNIADISIRAIEAFAKAEVILCEDTRVTKKLIQLLHERYGLHVNHPRYISLHSHNEAHWIKTLEPSFFDQNVIYASDAGMPGISDPGALLVRYCIDHGLAYDVLPGANALLTAFAASGFATTRISFQGFLPHKGAERDAALEAALFNGMTTVLYESPHRLRKLLDALHVRVPSRRLFLAKELSKKFQNYHHGTASELLERMDETIRGEWVVVIEEGAAQTGAISEADILALNLPKKQAARLISKITGENSKACYARLIDLEVK
ncbi:MAG: 16S rRNA (cytidine(1402)-2'-O)-methyltransferase [Campylobacterales bacterium]|nr:16S rRNA (cytidine(1402)-2'-O)-methyltransferase [Campylobacterales bacterium]